MITTIKADQTADRLVPIGAIEAGDPSFWHKSIFYHYQETGGRGRGWNLTRAIVLTRAEFIKNYM